MTGSCRRRQRCHCFGPPQARTIQLYPYCHTKHPHPCPSVHRSMLRMRHPAAARVFTPQRTRTMSFVQRMQPLGAHHQRKEPSRGIEAASDRVLLRRRRQGREMRLATGEHARSSRHTVRVCMHSDWGRYPPLQGLHSHATLFICILRMTSDHSKLQDLHFGP